MQIFLYVVEPRLHIRLQLLVRVSFRSFWPLEGKPQTIWKQCKFYNFSIILNVKLFKEVYFSRTIIRLYYAPSYHTRIVCVRTYILQIHNITYSINAHSLLLHLNAMILSMETNCSWQWHPPPLSFSFYFRPPPPRWPPPPPTVPQTTNQDDQPTTMTTLITCNY